MTEIGRVTRSRVTQLMNLLSLAPDIQEQILALPGDFEILEHAMRVVCRELDWGEQREIWVKIRESLPR